MAHIRAIETALPQHELRQSDMLALLQENHPDSLPPRMVSILENSGVETRSIAMPIAEYFAPRKWHDRMATYESVGMAMFESAARDALRSAGFGPLDIDAIVFVSTSGTMTPSMPSRMIERMGFDPGVMTVPVFGYGCAGGALGLRLAGDIAKRRGNVLLVTLELCSLAYDSDRSDMKNFVAAALFSDGCAAVVVSRDGGGPRIGAMAQRCWPDTVNMMGWHIGPTGFDLVLAKSIPHFVESEFAPFCDEYLAVEDIGLDEMGEPACHPGGGKVIDAMAAYFAPDQPRETALPATRKVLRDHGNMSSPTVLFVLKDVLARQCKRPFLYTALGPGFTGAVGLVMP